MAATRDHLTVVGFVALYLILSFGPFAALNWEVIQAAVRSQWPPDPLLIVIWTGLLVVLLVGIFRAHYGVRRYTHFLRAPTDPLSALVAVSFVWAACSWWAIPELAVAYGLDLTIDVVLALIFLSQLPMLGFLSLMAAIGFATDS